jgi:hypothetical protein
MHNADAGVVDGFDEFPSVVGGAVVDHDQLEIADRLGEHRLDARSDRPLGVECRYDDRKRGPPLLRALIVHVFRLS